MKKTNYFILCSLFGAALTTASCVDSDKDFSKPGETETGKTTDLNVPADFTWETTRNVNVEVSAPVSSYVSLYTNADCTAESLLAVSDINSGETTDLQITVPAGNNKLYVKYPTSETTMAVAALDITKRTAVRGSDKDDIFYCDADFLKGIYEGTNPDAELKGNNVFCSGSVVFEDNWPNRGDYDFNDLVIDYEIKAHVDRGNQKSNRIEVEITIRAIGGYLPAKLGFRFVDNDNKGLLAQKYIGRYKGLEKQDGLTVSLGNPGKADESPIFIISDLNDLKKGQTFYNTEKEDVDDDDLAELEFDIYPGEGNKNEIYAAFREAARAVNQDFFLITANNREIHLRGYEATSLYTGYASDAASSTDVKMSKTIPYCTDNNFVWGLKLPSEFEFPLEKIDINEAYAPNFNKWVESSGTIASSWYRTPVKGKVATW